MNLSDLIQIFSHQNRQPFSLQGNFGTIHLTPELHDNKNTYQINCNYKSLTRHGWHYSTRQAGGFRLSTACCLAACVLFGEERVTQGMIQKINKELKIQE